MWYTGQKVVCIETRTGALTVGKVYTVLGIWECCLVNLDVGLTARVGTHCKKCNEVKRGSVWWINSKQFVPLEEWEETDSIVEEMLKEITITEPVIGN